MLGSLQSSEANLLDEESPHFASDSISVAQIADANAAPMTQPSSSLSSCPIDVVEPVDDRQAADSLSSDAVDILGFIDDARPLEDVQHFAGE